MNRDYTDKVKVISEVYLSEKDYNFETDSLQIREDSRDQEWVGAMVR